MSVIALAQWIETTPLSLAVAESDWLFPALESTHVAALALVVGSISIVDLRLLGLASRGRSPTELGAAALPLTWIGFGFAVATGVLMFLAKPTSYLANPFFLIKIGLLALAGLNMAAFHVAFAGNLAGAGAHLPPPPAVRVSAALSLLLWVSIVACGRWIGFTI
jgi:hypothetical protein